MGFAAHFSVLDRRSLNLCLHPFGLANFHQIEILPMVWQIHWDRFHAPNGMATRRQLKRRPFQLVWNRTAHLIFWPSPNHLAVPRPARGGLGGSKLEPRVSTEQNMSHSSQPSMRQSGIRSSFFCAGPKVFKPLFASIWIGKLSSNWNPASGMADSLRPLPRAKWYGNAKTAQETAFPIGMESDRSFDFLTFSQPPCSAAASKGWAIPRPQRIMAWRPFPGSFSPTQKSSFVDLRSFVVPGSVPGHPGGRGVPLVGSSIAHARVLTRARCFLVIRRSPLLSWGSRAWNWARRPENNRTGPESLSERIDQSVATEARQRTASEEPPTCSSIARWDYLSLQWPPASRCGAPF